MGVISLDLQQTDAGYNVKKEIERLDKEIDDEVAARVAADTSIWEEIETIEAASDVVDVVGTYEALENYDTSKLQDNDLIKVLQDETRDDAITYYRWSKTSNAFTYVGAEGPYYTASETDTLLAAKQDTLVAGTNIQIAADGKTISATDTTYTHFTGATASTDGVQGLVPGPLAGDEDKYLKADGTWATVQSGGATVTLYPKFTSPGLVFEGLFKDQALTEEAYGMEIVQMMRNGTVLVDMDIASRGIFKISYGYDGDEGVHLFEAYGFEMVAGGRQGSGCIRMHVRSYQESSGSYDFQQVVFQPRLTAGSNISINDNVISATDTTYSNFVGTDGTDPGAAGLVPAPAVTDDDKYLKSDGTWSTVQSGGTTTMFYSQDNVLYKDSARTVAATGSEVVAACGTGDVVINMKQLDNSALKELHVVSYVDGGNWAAIVAVSYYRNMDGGPMIIDWHYTNANSTTAAYHRYTQLQKTLTAGSNITISGSTISARDTTYSAFGGATSQVAGTSGLVPAPAIGDDTKYLKGDGTWATVRDGGGMTQYYIDSADLVVGNIALYKEEGLVNVATGQEFAEAVVSGPVRITTVGNGARALDLVGYYDDCALGPSYVPDCATYTFMCGYNNRVYRFEDVSAAGATIRYNGYRDLQPLLTAGSNISISNNTISATDTTYTAGTGIAISAQNVISASPNNISSNDWSGLWQ